MSSYYKILNISVLSLLLIIQPAFCLIGQTTRLIVIDPLVENEIKTRINTELSQKVITLPDSGNPIKFITNELRGSSFDEIHLFHEQRLQLAAFPCGQVGTDLESGEVSPTSI